MNDKFLKFLDDEINTLYVKLNLKTTKGKLQRDLIIKFDLLVKIKDEYKKLGI